MREHRVNRGRKDLHYPEALVSGVPDNGSGSKTNLSYYAVNGNGGGQVKLDNRREKVSG